MMLPVALAAIAFLGGCYQGDLTVDIHVVREMNSLIYHLDPKGHLTLSEGGGIVEGAAGREIYDTDLVAADMRTLKKTVHNSGFLVEPQPIKSSLTGGMFLVIEAKLGMWENDLRIRGIQVESVRKITDALDKHLPDRYRIRYSAAAALDDDEDYKKYLDP